MDTHAYHLKLISLVAVTAMNSLALVVFACSPFALDYPLAALGIVAFLLVQVFLPACQPNVETPLCPANLAQAFFWVQLVLVPLLIGFYGISPGTLPRLPSTDAINTGIVLRVLAYVCFCGAYQYFAPSQPCDAAAEDDVGNMESLATPWTIIGIFAAVGLIGWLLYYGGVAGFLELIASPTEQRERELEPTTLVVAAGNFLRHFLGFALVWAWSAWVSRRAGRRNGLLIAGVTAILIALLLIANFSYNRGTLLAPILALAAAYSAHVRRISFTLIGIAGAAVLAAAFTFGGYRATNMQLADVTSADLGAAWSDQHQIVDFVQIYGSGPQFTGFLIEELEMANKSFRGATLLPSILYPIPVLGKPFRDTSGVFLFNEMIYGDPEVLDQNLAYDAELYMNFNFVGVIVGYLLLGWLQTILQTRFLAAERPVESYLWLLVALWTVFPGSLPVLSQLCVYSFWPIYAYWFVRDIAWRPITLAKGWVVP